MPMKLRFLLLLTLFFALGQSADAKIFLVSAGISDYPGTKNDLRLCAADADTVAWIYGKNQKAMSRVLTNTQATAANILSAMAQLFAAAGENDIVVFFFSGHGLPGYFIAYDQRLSYAEVRKAMASCRARHKMIFADACFSGKIRTKDRSSQSEEAAKKAEVMLFLSSRSSETSIERPRTMTNGIFTTYLQKGLRGRADANRDRTITARELFDYVSRNVQKASANKQHPVMWGRFADTMPVMIW